MWAKPSSSIIYNSFLREIRVLQALGIYPYDEWSKLWFHCYAWIYLVVVLPIVYMSGVYLLTTNVTVQDATEPVLFFTFFSVVTVKYAYSKLSTGYTRKSLEWLNHPIFNHILDEEKHILNEALKHYSTLSRIGYSASSSTLFFWSITLLLEDKKRPWIPLTEESSLFLNVAVYLILIVGLAYSLTADMSQTLVIAGLVYQATIQIRIIKSMMNHLPEYASAQITKGEPANRKNDIVYYQISQCAYRYSLVKSFVADIQQSFWLPLFCHIFDGGLCYCFLCFQIVEMDLFSYESVTAVVSLILTTLNVYVHCLVGNMLYSETFDLNTDLYLTDWVSLDPKSKRIFLILQECTKEPITIKASRMVDVSLETFAMIIRRSYSLLTLMQQNKR